MQIKDYIRQLPNGCELTVEDVMIALFPDCPDWKRGYHVRKINHAFHMVAKEDRVVQLRKRGRYRMIIWRRVEPMTDLGMESITISVEANDKKNPPNRCMHIFSIMCLFENPVPFLYNGASIFLFFKEEMGPVPAQGPGIFMDK